MDIEENFRIIYQNVDDIIHETIGIGDMEKAENIYDKCYEIKKMLVEIHEKFGGE